MKEGQFKDIYYPPEDTCKVISKILHKLAMIVLSNVIIMIVVIVATHSTLVSTFCLNFKPALDIRSDVVT